MAVSSLYPFNPNLHYHSKIPSRSYFSSHSLSSPTKAREIVNDTRRGRSRMGRLVVSSTHSNAKILKSNKKSRFGRTLSPYVSDEDTDDNEEKEEDGDDGDDGEEEDCFAKNDWLLDMSFFDI